MKRQKGEEDGGDGKVVLAVGKRERKQEKWKMRR